MIDPIEQRTGADARLGGLDITVSLTPTQARAVGTDAGMLLDWLHTALHAISMLRTGLDADGQPYTPSPDRWWDAVAALDHRLIPRIEGIRDAIARAHDREGGTLTDLALAMDVPKSTAQYRRDVLRRTTTGTWEKWASGDRS